jgi:ankyrin repeat protein
VVQFLQKRYASLYGNLGSSGCRAIEVAILRGRIGVVERYMQKLSDPKIEMPADAIATAALGGQDTMIGLLVDQGLDLNEEGVFGTPLRAASIMCHESTVRLLLRLGASPHVSGSFGEPLQAAAMRGHEAITRNLLSSGADVNSKGGLYGTALQAAAHRGHPKVVEILLDAGADVYRDGFSRDAFHAASEGGHEEIVRLLLERGFKLRHAIPVAEQMSGPIRYRNLLRDASPSRPRETTPTRDHQPGSKDWRERASMVDFSHVVERTRGVVTSGLELIQPYRERPGYQADKEENYALRAAAAEGHVRVVELLLSELDEMDIPRSEIVAALKQACENGHDKVVTQLLSEQVEAMDLEAALKAAALKGHLTVVNLLIDREDRLGLARVATVGFINISKSPTQVRRPTYLAVPRGRC